MTHRILRSALLVLATMSPVMSEGRAQESPPPDTTSPSVMHPRQGSEDLGYWMLGPYIKRWRVEKKDPAAAVSDVVRPIVYRVDATVPRRWVPWIAKGILAWNPAFEALGFRHAIVVQDSGPRAKLPDGSDAPECLVQWSTNFMEGAYTAADGGDTRSGEILHCTVTLNDGIVGLLQSYAFVYLGGFEPRFRYPFPDSISGRLLQMTVSHEAGHGLGFREDFAAGTMYPTDSLRSAAFVHRMGPAASIMAYTFVDAVAQPEDHIPFEDLLAHVGPYDVWMLEAGYGPDTTLALSAGGPASLAQWPSVSDGQDMVGRDLLPSAELISRNLARSAPLIAAQHDTSSIITSVQMALKMSLPQYLYGQAVNQWGLALAGAIDVLIGGTVPQTVAEREAEKPPVPLDSARQVEALRFAIAHVYYGRDPFVQAVFQRTPSDTGVMLFDTVPAGWTVEQWQTMQRAMASHIVKRVTEAAEQPNTTHVLPVLCGEFARVERELTAARTSAPRPGGRDQATKLQERVHRLFDPTQQGVCTPQGAPSP